LKLNKGVNSQWFYDLWHQLRPSDVSAKLKVTWHKTRTNIKKSGRIKLRHCALV